MARRQLLCSGSGMAGKSMPLRIRDTYDCPFSVPILERVLHGHPVDYTGIVFWMEGHGSVRQIAVKGNRSCRYIETLQIEARACLKPVQNRRLHCLLILNAATATRKYHDH